jgi:two-component system nitrogen regulation sensor histidine kinase NtrY
MASGRRTVGWIAMVLVLLGAVWGLYALFAQLAEAGPDLDVNQILLPALSLMLVVVALGLAGILIRNLVRLIVDRKRGILGARLRTKLVFFFLALVLLPATILFWGSAQVIKQTVEAILRTPLEDINRTSREIVDDWNAYFQEQSYRRARTIAGEIERDRLLDPGEAGTLERLLLRWQEQDELQLIWVASGSGVIAHAGELLRAADAEFERQADELIADLIARSAEHGEAIRGIDYWGDGLLAHAAIPLIDAEAGGTRAGTVIVGIVLPTRLAENLAAIDRAAGAYTRFRAQRRELVRLYLTLIGLVFLLTLFVATWIGLYLSRRITGPIQQLAAASREISAGNLDVRVRSQIGDELGMLVDAFNEMAGELQENKEVITKSTADLRRSNRDLDERRRYIETLLANLSTAVLSLDPVGRVTTANPAVREILGVELEVGRPARQTFAEHGLEPLVRLLEQVVEGRGDGLRRDLTLPLRSGALNVAVQVSPLRRTSGEDLGTLIMVEDLTALLRAQKAAAWREVARRIAHEIKNPLTPIQLSAQRLRKKVAEDAEDLGQVVPEAAASIEREVGALKRLVDEFSRFARMPELSLQQVDVVQLVESVRTLYRGHPGIDWELDVDPGIGPVTLDPEQMRRVLINLIDNSVAAMDGRGTIALSVRPPTADGTLRIEFADTGPGLPPGDRDKVFSPYFSTKKRGTGLGLAIVHRVVTDHRGSIHVEENRPRGVRFVIEVPV